MVIDDGSRNVADLIPVHEDFSTGRFRVMLRPENTGKRACQAVAFGETDSDIVVTIDSDTVLDPRAIQTIVRRFSDERVGAVTGHVEVINRRHNLLTRLIAYRYWTAFNQEPAAQSLFGVVMCASGPFSAYRRSAIDAVKDRYVNQTFLGRPCTFGDDRHLTNLVLDLGYRVVFDEKAVARTSVPTSVRGYLRQQTRWNKSFYREILWTAKFAHRRHPYLALDLVLQTVMPPALLVALAATAYAAIAEPSVLWRYGAVVAGIGLLRALYGLLRTRSLGFVLFMLYGFVHVFLLIPVRIFALATMANTDWGTRGSSGDDDEVEQSRRRVVRARSEEGLAAAETAWRRDIRTRVANADDFALYVQPVRHLWSGETTHAEALLRLRHDGEVLPAATFLSIAEDHGLMAATDAWVVREALRVLAAHARDGVPLRLEVNVSSDSMRDEQLSSLIGRWLAEQDVPARNLVLAIAEETAQREPCHRATLRSSAPRTASMRDHSRRCDIAQIAARGVSLARRILAGGTRLGAPGTVQVLEVYPYATLARLGRDDPRLRPRERGEDDEAFAARVVDRLAQHARGIDDHADALRDDTSWTR